MSANMYVRLMAMSVTLMLWVTTVAALMVWVNTVHGLRPSVSWEKVHLNWNRASRFLWAKYTPLDRMLQLFIWWSVPSSTAVSFLFLGFGEDALEGYRKIGDAIVRIISSRVLPNRGEKSRKGISPVSPLPPSGSRSVLFTMVQVAPLTLSNAASADRPLHFRQMRRRQTKRSRSCCPFNLPDRCIP